VAAAWVPERPCSVGGAGVRGGPWVCGAGVEEGPAALVAGLPLGTASAYSTACMPKPILFL